MIETSKMPIITISREYYAGGRSVARKLSEQLNVEMYDKDFVKLASAISGYSEEEIQEEGEEISRLESIVDNMLASVNLFTSSHDEIHKAERDAVLELAKRPCIIIGRCANMILREAGIPSIDILLYADKEIRIKRYMDKYDRSYDEAAKYVNERDRFRKTYNEKYAGKGFFDCHNFTACFDTGVLGYEKCSEMIIDIIRSYQE